MNAQLLNNESKESRGASGREIKNLTGFVIVSDYVGRQI